MIVLQQFSLIVTNGSGILPDVAGVIDAARQFCEFFGLDGAQEMQTDPGHRGDPFQCEPLRSLCGLRFKLSSDLWVSAALSV